MAWRRLWYLRLVPACIHPSHQLPTTPSITSRSSSETDCTQRRRNRWRRVACAMGVDRML